MLDIDIVQKDFLFDTKEQIDRALMNVATLKVCLVQSLLNGSPTLHPNVEKDERMIQELRSKDTPLDDITLAHRAPTEDDSSVVKESDKTSPLDHKSDIQSNPSKRQSLTYTMNQTIDLPDTVIPKSIFQMSSEEERNSEDDIAALFNPLEQDIAMHSSHIDTKDTASSKPINLQPRRKLSTKFDSIDSNDSDDIILMMNPAVKTSPLCGVVSSVTKTASASTHTNETPIKSSKTSQILYNDENNAPQPQTDKQPPIDKQTQPQIDKQTQPQPQIDKQPQSQQHTPNKHNPCRLIQKESTSQQTTPKLGILRSSSRTHDPFRPTVIKPIPKLIGTPIDTSVSKRKKKEEMDKVIYLTEREYKLKSIAELKHQTESNKRVGD